jgi:hypothetical protein
MDEHFADFKSKQLTSDDLHELMARLAVGGAAINGLLIATAVHCIKSQRERERAAGRGRRAHSHFLFP